MKPKKFDPSVVTAKVREILDVDIVDYEDSANIASSVRLDAVRTFLGLKDYASELTIEEDSSSIHFYFEKKVARGPNPHVSVFIKNMGFANVTVRNVTNSYSDYPNIPVDAVVPLVLPELTILFANRDKKKKK